MDMNQPVNGRISKLRSIMERNGLDYYLVTGTDAHLSEYVCPHWRTREFITGFTGSAGTVLVGRSEALLWTDSRYFIQAFQQLGGTCVTLMKDGEEGVPSIEEYLRKNASPSSRVGTCASEISVRDYREKKKLYESMGLEFVLCDDYLGEIWTDRPALPETKIRVMPAATAGRSREEKLAMIREKLKEKGADYTFIAAIDDIAWITNLRADDVPCNPVFLSYMFISQEKAVLFTSLCRFSASVLEEVGKCIEVRHYDEVQTLLPSLSSGRAYYNDEKVNASFISLLDTPSSITGRDFSTDMKACKNPVELEGMRKSHMMDGAAFINAFSRVDFSKTDGTYNEIAISSLFASEREKMEGYEGPSFNPISGFASHGAMCHYSADEESNASIDHDGLLVLDTGSQFSYGMTDLTRTLLFGSATDGQRRDYTLVLKGHLSLMHQKFIYGTRGYQLDVLAKQFMWNEEMSFYHGTGHGVGFNLNVHEGPERISSHPIDVVLEEGMVISDEPGIYKEGRHGIRIENLIAVRKAEKTEFGQFMEFENLTLVPYERKLIDRSLLTREEIDEIDLYHKKVYETLYPLVRQDARSYLRSATLPL